MNPAGPLVDHHPRVLVVDDDGAVLTMAEAVLAAFGFQALPAVSGEQAATLYRAARSRDAAPDVVLLDITLPGGMNGIETLDALREIDPGVRVLATSGFFDASAARAARRRGFLGILPKPYSAEKLVRMVRWALAH